MPKKRIEKLISIEVDNIVEKMLSSKRKELHVYDFDDTLVSSAAVVLVRNKKTGTVTKLHPHKFHEYHPKKDEEFDLSDFDKLLQPTMLPHCKKLFDDYARLGPDFVAILTARPQPAAHAVRKFLDSQGLFNVVIAAIGDPNPSMNVQDINARRKKAWLKQQIEERELKYLSFYDDNAANIEAAKELEYEHPDVSFAIELVV